MKNLLLEYRLRKLENKYNEAKQVGDIYHVAELSIAGNIADSDQLGQFLPGAELKKLGEEGEWTIIEFQGGKGYVKTEFLE